MNKLIKRLMGCALIICILFCNTIPVFAQDVYVEIQTAPKIDIVLSSKETNVDLTNFEEDIRNAVKELGIDDSEFKFSLANTVNTTIDDNNASYIINNWETFPKGTKSNWYYDGSAITSSVNEPYETGFYDTKNGYISNLTLSGKCFSNENTQPMGYIIRMSKQENNTNRYNGYFLWVSAVDGFNYNQNVGGQAATKISQLTGMQRVVALFKFEGLLLDYNLYKSFGQTYSATPLCSVIYNGTYCFGWAYHLPRNYGGYPDGTKMQNGITVTNTFDSSLKTTTLGYAIIDTSEQYFDLGINVKNKTFTVFYNNNNIFSVTDENAFESGYYGLFEYSHRKPKFYNLDVTFESYKEYKEILLQPEWRKEAHHIVVNVDDEIDDSLTGSDNEGEILSRTLNDNIHFIQWGTDINKTDITEFINNNDKKGIFIDNSNYNNCVNQTAIYIKNLIEQTKQSQYVIAGENVNLYVTPEDLKTNAISTDYPNGRWKVHHIPEYFANDEGLSQNTESYSKNLMCNFDKVGKYEIYFDDNLVKEVYAHRNPVADFDIKITGNNLTLTSKSYDLDENKDIGYGKGIQSEKWYYKKINSTEWTEGKLTTFTSNEVTLIKLEVTDYQGATQSTVKYIGQGAPVAIFSLEETNLTTAQSLNITDSSYDPQGLDITKYEWTLKKDKTVINTYTTQTFPDIDLYELGVGNYTIDLKITNSANISSETFTQNFTLETAKFKNVYKHYLYGFNGDGNNSTKDAYLLQTTYGEVEYKNIFKPDATYALTVPNGCYLQNQFKTSQITGVPTLFNFGLNITQPAYVMNFEYNYYPIEYTITYNLDGGTNNSENPDTYTVLYGVELKAPTRTGYDFVGWCDENGNKITGINEGCTATFTNTLDLYNKLKSRTTGNIEITARYQLHDYEINTTYTGSGVVSNSSKVTYKEDTSVFIIPATGYSLTELKIDNVSVSPVESYNFINVESDHKIEATFTITQTRKMELIKNAYSWIDLKLK